MASEPAFSSRSIFYAKIAAGGKKKIVAHKARETAIAKTNSLLPQSPFIAYSDVGKIVPRASSGSGQELVILGFDSSNPEAAIKVLFVCLWEGFLSWTTF